MREQRENEILNKLVKELFEFVYKFEYGVWWLDGESKDRALFEDYLYDSVPWLHQLSKYKIHQKVKRMEMKEGASLLNLRSELEAIGSMEPPLSSYCCIYKVPPIIRKVNEEAYTPSLVSIGPFHRENQRLKPKQQLKLRYLHKFLKRNQEKSLNDYAKFLKDSEDIIRHCYSETIPMESDEFVSMILIDACFIIELLVTQYEDQPSGPRVSKGEIMLDLILIENQLPFFVLEGLFCEAFPMGFNGELSFLHLIIPIFIFHFSKNIYYSPDDKMFDMSSFTKQVKHHLCDILRTFCLPSNPPPIIRAEATLKRSYSVSQLNDTGLKLLPCQGKMLTEVEFEEGALRMPKIKASNVFERLLRNVVAFEQCHYPYELYVSDSVALLGFLIQSEKDVEILVEKGIMESFLDGRRVASMFNDLHMNIIGYGSNAYVDLHKELDKFYNNTWHKYKAIFVRDYWSTPWKKASSTAAVLLLFLTLIQAICSIVSLFKM